MPENYNGTAIDSDVVEQLSPEDIEDTTENDVNDSVDVDNDDENIIETVDEPNEVPPSTYNIDGEDVTVEQIREWKNSGLRQDDYTRKTQELAKNRAELQDAVNTYSYLKAHPYVIDSIKKAENNPQFNNVAPSPERDAIRDLQYQVQSMRVDEQLKSLHDIYGDFDEDKLFNAATNAKTTDLELVLKSMMYDNKPSVDAIEEAKKQLKEELEKDQDVVSTTITNKSSKKHQSSRLSSDEKHIAEAFGMSPREYAKWKE